MEYEAGQIVYSKSGHDKGKIFIILSVEGEYVYLADGKCRSLEKPKRKKIKHIQPTKFVSEFLKEKLIEKSYLLNADIVKVLREYNKNEGGF
ncbi:MAG TPA: KOW domain-containing RNA-binding protein [Candidatus Coprocola pullicola]|nr:KOW domain-containing RNA-binding protein [Candidatus Coprocola pullicola]